MGAGVSDWVRASSGQIVVGKGNLMNSYILNRRAFLSAAGAVPVLSLLAGIADAAKPVVFTDEGVAIRGYDPVA